MNDKSPPFFYNILAPKKQIGLQILMLNIIVIVISEYIYKIDLNFLVKLNVNSLMQWIDNVFCS